MAGHKISGYIFSLWKALFAFLRRLFRYRLFLGKDNTDEPEPEQPSSSPPADATWSANNPSTAAPATHPPSPTGAHPAPAPAHPPVGSTSTAARHLDPDPDLENAFASGDEDMASSRKRGGQKRGGAGLGAKPAHATADTQHRQQQRDKENVSPSKQPNQGLGSDPATTASTPAPLAPRKDNAPEDPAVVSANAHQKRQPPGHDAVVRTPSSTCVQTLGDGQKGSAAAATAAPTREVPKPAVPQLSPTPTVAPSKNTSELQKPGGDGATGAQDADLAVKSAQQADQASNMQMDQASAAVAQLNLQGQPPPAQEMDKDSAAVESAGVPSVSAVPKMLITPKPLAPLVTPPSQVLPGLIEPTTEEGKKERAEHLKFMREALEMGQLALNTNETPVGCVLVYRGRIIAKGMNATNITRNGTRHAEFMALSALLSHPEDADVVDEDALDESSWGDVAPEDGHVFPYGQKLHPSPKVSRSIISECVLYVTVEPCVMCASLLRQLCIKRVYFGAVNDKFGGTGGVFRIHQNSLRVPETTDRPYQNGYGPMDMETVAKNRAAATAIRPEQDGDGGNVEPGYPAEGGFLRDEAVSLLRRFYVQENGRAPQPRKKEGRAARLYAMENQAAGVSSSDLSDGMAPADTAVDTEPTSADQDKFPDDAQDGSAKA